VRAMIVPITLGLKAIWDATGLVGGTLLIGALVFGVALAALWSLPETYGKDLDYTE
jgi:putative MFS transporter